MTDIINARSQSIPAGPITPIEALLTTQQIFTLTRRLRDDAAEIATERARRASAGLPCIGHARALAALQTDAAELEAR